uniref:Uncharacterized protein n=1 Tax=Catharus ustulatus TaxID=91951 RepID=A0A8C3U0H7_CATUS
MRGRGRRLGERRRAEVGEESLKRSPAGRWRSGAESGARRARAAPAFLRSPPDPRRTHAGQKTLPDAALCRHLSCPAALPGRRAAAGGTALAAR